MKKDFNQYYGQYVEEAVNSIINNLPIINNTKIDFSQEDITLMNKAGKTIANNFKKGKSIYIGRSVNKANGDLLIDGKSVEIKFVSTGKGTYFNTSLSYIPNNLNFIGYNKYLENHGYIEELKNHFGDIVSTKNISPVSTKMSSEIRNNHPEIYQKLSDKESKIRELYSEDFYNHLLNNKKDFNIFVNDMISKNKSGKQAPDIIVVYNYLKDSLTIFDELYINKCKISENIRNTGKGLDFDLFRVAIGWQNGNGLCNPTLRVFIK